MTQKPLRRVAYALVASFFLLALPAPAALEQAHKEQADKERELEAVVRNKSFYKRGHVEVAVVGGIMPYDSAVSHTTIGGRVTWHLSDHYGWEILDLGVASSSIPSFTTDLVTSKGLSNLQVTALKLVASTSFVASPVYGKIRLFGASVMYFDFYAVVGAGMANTSDLMFSTTKTGGAVTQSVVKTSFDPMINAGIGMKIFFNSVLGIVVDLRDYMTYSEKYGKKSLTNNFTVQLGLSVFIPSF